MQTKITFILILFISNVTFSQDLNKKYKKDIQPQYAEFYPTEYFVKEINKINVPLQKAQYIDSIYYQDKSDIWSDNETKKYNVVSRNTKGLVTKMRFYNLSGTDWIATGELEINYHDNNSIYKINQEWNEIQNPERIKCRYAEFTSTGLIKEEWYKNTSSTKDFPVDVSPFKKTYSYNSHNAVDTIIAFSLENDIWLNYARKIFLYNNQEKVEFIYQEIWNSNTWNKNSKQEFVYNNQQQILYHIDYSWNDTETRFLETRKISNIYNPSNYLVNVVYYDWNSLINNWEEGYRRIIEVDANGNKLSEYTKYKVDDDWYYGNKTLYTYTNSQLLSDSTTCLWDADNSIWINLYNYKFEHNDEGLVSKYTFQSWDSDSESWISSSYRDYFYDEYEKPTEINYYLWSDILNNWELTKEIEYIYNQRGNIVQLSEQLLDQASNEWFYVYKVNYYLSEVSLSIDKQEKIFYTVYPNPSNGIIAIESFNKNIKQNYLEIFNIHGVLILSYKFQKGIHVDLSNYPKGTYIIYINHRYTRKILVI